MYRGKSHHRGKTVLLPSRSHEPYVALGDGSPLGAGEGEVGGNLVHVKLADKVDQLAVNLAMRVLLVFFSTRTPSHQP